VQCSHAQRSFKGGLLLEEILRIDTEAYRTIAAPLILKNMQKRIAARDTILAAMATPST
jgi:hypothetical protein